MPATQTLPGSSPLARGLPARGGHRPSPRRIIPARAGFTQPLSEWPQSPRDHPRSRGVYYSVWGPGTEVTGSSPLARGLLTLKVRSAVLAGIIPARAGFTRALGTRLRTLRDHPRSRGVYHSPDGALNVFEGSSPLARGLLSISNQKKGKSRIIPARAGFTVRITSARCPQMGSSPLARGLLFVIPEKYTESRIIPARAGFTPLSA